MASIKNHGPKTRNISERATEHRDLWRIVFLTVAGDPS